MTRYTTEMDGHTRDRYLNPSINFPKSEEEAFQAILRDARRALVDRLTDRVFTTDAGLGHTRSQQQADWLTRQQQLLRTRFEDFLDALDLENRT